MIGAAGISAFPMSGRVVHKMGLAEDPQNFLLMQSMGVDVRNLEPVTLEELIKEAKEQSDIAKIK